MKTKTAIRFAVSLLALTGCGKLNLGTGPSASPGLQSTAISGKVSGNTWNMAGGQAQKSTDGNSTDVDVILWDNGSHLPCQNFQSALYNERAVYLTLTLKNGQYTLGSSSFPNAGFTYQIPGGYLPQTATGGTLSIDSHSPTTVQGRVALQKGNDTVNGQFNVQFCQ